MTTYLKMYTFSVEACYYYIQQRWKRILKIITEPPEIKVQKAADKLDLAVQEVGRRCLLLTQVTVQRMAADLEAAKRDAAQTRNLVEGKCCSDTNTGNRICTLNFTD